ncbi:MAG: hypothetical protein AB7V18_19465 [Pyrinomonadaceae bacterium]
MIYCYTCDICGVTYEETYGMGKQPQSIPCKCGEQALRDWAAEGTQVDDRPLDSKYPYVSNRLPRNLEGCKTDHNGKPVVMSKKHEREIMAKHGYSRE